MGCGLEVGREERRGKATEQRRLLRSLVASASAVRWMLQQHTSGRLHWDEAISGTRRGEDCTAAAAHDGLYQHPPGPSTPLSTSLYLCRCLTTPSHTPAPAAHLCLSSSPSPRVPSVPARIRYLPSSLSSSPPCCSCVHLVGEHRSRSTLIHHHGLPRLPRPLPPVPSSLCVPLLSRPSSSTCSPPHLSLVPSLPSTLISLVPCSPLPSPLPPPRLPPLPPSSRHAGRSADWLGGE